MVCDTIRQKQVYLFEMGTEHTKKEFVFFCIETLDQEIRDSWTVEIPHDKQVKKTERWRRQMFLFRGGKEGIEQISMSNTFDRHD